MKQIFIDVETTGTDPKIHCVWQIAFIIEVNGKEDCRHNFKTAPIPGSQYNDKALEVGNITAEEIKSFPDSYKTLRDIKEVFKTYVDPYNKTDKMFFTAYNAEFDMKFLRSFFERQNDKYIGSWFWFPYIDTMTLAGKLLMVERSGMKDFKLGTVASMFGIEIDKSRLHDAMYDVELCRDIYRDTIVTKDER